MKIKDLYFDVDARDLVEVSETICKVVRNKIDINVLIYRNALVNKDFTLYFKEYIDINSLSDILDDLKDKRLGFESYDNIIDMLKDLEEKHCLHVHIIRKD